MAKPIWQVPSTDDDDDGPIWQVPTEEPSGPPSDTPIWQVPSTPAPSAPGPPSTPIWQVPSPAESPSSDGNPALPIWHPDRYPKSTDSFRAPADPIKLDGRPLAPKKKSPTTKSPLLPSVEDLESNANFTFLQTLLNSYGLGDAFDVMKDLIADDASAAEIELAIRDTPVFRERFPQIFSREANNQSPVSPADIINYETQLEGMLSFYGVPPEVGGSVQELAADLMSDDVSLNQVAQRLVAQRVFADEVLNDPEMDVEAVQAILGEGVSPYDIASYALNPDNALAEITQRLEAANISNEASQADYGISAEEALALQQGGLTPQQAQQGFGSLVQQNQVVDGIGNEEDPVTRAQELAALTGDVAANAAIERARRTRTGAFEVGGGFARDDDGFGGLR